jgi:hypothetical protein
MWAAYVTNDEVNLREAHEIAGACAITLCPLMPMTIDVDDDFDALIYDLDHLPPENRQVILENLLGGALPEPIAVHSYHLEPSQVKGLRARGVLVFSRLGFELFWRLSELPARLDHPHSFGAARAATQLREENRGCEDDLMNLRLAIDFTQQCKATMLPLRHHLLQFIVPSIVIPVLDRRQTWPTSIRKP